MDEFVIMPNHIHGILYLNPIDKTDWTPNKFGPQSNNLGAIIRGFISSVKRYANQINIEFDWQTRYPDRIIRNEKEYHAKKNYFISMIVESNESVDVSKISADREDGKSRQSNIKRKDVKVDDITETKLLNFYSAVGINFQNIASNDAAIAAKLTEVASQGWELTFVTSGVESDAGEKDGKGIFITRYIFKRAIR